MVKQILLRLANDGKPIVSSTNPNGILLFPSIPLPPSYKQGDVLFTLSIEINASSEVSRDGKLHVNTPEKGSDEFVRSKFHSFDLHSSFHNDVRVEIPIFRPGPFCFYISYRDFEGKDNKTKEVYFIVPPNLTTNGEFVPFNNINLQTVVSKWAGPLDQWDALFKSISNKGYNMIHFTPIQERGQSNSPYSIYDQLKLDPKLFSSNEKGVAFIKDLLKKHKLLSITDVVWNHTADNSEWLREHPESGYNVETAPHLQAAIELDAKLFEYSDKLKHLGLPTDLKSANDLDSIISKLNEYVLKPLKLWQYYVFDKIETLESLKKVYYEQNGNITPIEIPSDLNTQNLKELANFSLKRTNLNDDIIFKGRFDNKLDVNKFLSVLISLVGEDADRFDSIHTIGNSIIDEINLSLYRSYDEDVSTMKQQLWDRIRYLRLDEDGPKLGPISSEIPLIEPYFTRFKGNDGRNWALANNGWIWGGNPLVDFASSQSRAYVRREVVIWGDCVKLRYGSGPDDSPYLWNRVIEYTKFCASMFDGFRVDNAHSTPIHVAEALLDAARSVNPDLYVVAELFSGSEEMDKVFVERLGLNSLIREAMQAFSVSELSALVHRHGGNPIGSFTWLPLDDYSYNASKEPEKNKYPESSTELEIPKILNNELPHALFMDCTHDNATPAEKRTVEDTLPNAALVSFCSSAIGSVMGYDEVYPNLLDVVGEDREYTFGNNGIGEVKKILHSIRRSLALESEDPGKESEMYIHHEDQYINIQRVNSRTGKGWLLVARTKFHEYEPDQTITPVRLGGTKVKSEWTLSLQKAGEFKDDPKYLTGIPTEVKNLENPVIKTEGDETVIYLNKYFPPGSIAIFSTEILGADLSLDKYVKEGAIEASKDLNLYDLNALLFRAEAEERDASSGRDGTYYVPNFGNLAYCGLQGWVTALRHIIWENNLGHPICDHLRDGDWAFDYIVNRLDKYSQYSSPLRKFQRWLKERFDAIRSVPYFLRPRYFSLVLGIAYEAGRFRALTQLGENVKTATKFVQSLALTSVQMVGYMNNATLSPLEKVPSIAAGLPHFSNDYMRCWGRDVFISFRGLFIVTERYLDAKRHILGFGQTLKHGMIPNLLDSGKNPRYNARDAAWFYIQAIQEYYLNAPDGKSILDEKVKRRFPLDDRYIEFDDKEAFSYETSVRDLIYEILRRHAMGISYREANAGPNLDSQMSNEGFNVSVSVDWSTGFVHGGSQFNCGTWMDKMGESEKAGSKGVPGTPRDGAAIELQGLLKSALRFVNKLNDKGEFKYTEVSRHDGSKISLKDWENLIQDNFERCFYIPTDESEDEKYVIDRSLVNRRGIYKDLFKTGKPYEDYQLRANFPIAMVVSPELFNTRRALGAIKVADKVILGKVGMKTLDPSDWNYRPYYHNSEDSTDFATSKGRNYHQGPEWVWLTGYFLRAFSLFNLVESSKADRSTSWDLLKTELNERLQGNIEWIRNSPWAGLTELTNKDGEFCGDSTPTQAWSESCLLDLYYDFWKDEHYKGVE